MKTTKLLEGTWDGNYPDAKSIKEQNKELENLGIEVVFESTADGWTVSLIWLK